MRATWFIAVRWLMKSAAPISLSVRPSARRPRTSSSRGVRPYGVALAGDPARARSRGFSSATSLRRRLWPRPVAASFPASRRGERVLSRAARTAATSRWCARKAGLDRQAARLLHGRRRPEQASRALCSCHRGEAGDALQREGHHPPVAEVGEQGKPVGEQRQRLLTIACSLGQRPSRRRRSRSPTGRQRARCGSNASRIVTRPAGARPWHRRRRRGRRGQTAIDPGQRPIIQPTGLRQRLLEVLGRLCELEAVHRREAEAEPVRAPFRVVWDRGRWPDSRRSNLGPLHIALIDRQVTKREERFAPRRRRRVPEPRPVPATTVPPRTDRERATRPKGNEPSGERPLARRHARTIPGPPASCPARPPDGRPGSTPAAARSHSVFSARSR